MPDITKCPGDGCAIKNSCYRYVSESDDYQTWFDPTPAEEENNCEYFYPISE